MKKVTMRGHHLTTLVCSADLVQFKAIEKLDASYVGTAHYMGLAYFWDRDLQHSLRDATAWQRVKVHKLFLENGIPFDIEHSFFNTTELAREICVHVCKPRHFHSNKGEAK